MTISANYVNEYTFITHGTNNFTEEFHSGRRVRSYCGVDGYKYGTVSGSFYLESTTVVLYPDIGNELTSNLESVEYGIVGTLNGSMPNHSHLNDESQGGLLFEASIVDLDKYTTGEIDNMLATLSGSIHDPVSLSIELSNSLLDISTQQLTLNTQEANTILAGPTAGTKNIPSFRKLVAEDIPALSYIDTETDPVFTAWDKSTGISITESQISDFGTYLTSLAGLTTDNLTEGSTNKYFPGFTSLLTDYSFTDNSSNWDTAYGWGNHADVGYLTTESDPVFTGWDKSTGISITESQISDFGTYLAAASTGITANSWTINSSKANVNVNLTFGRTTGGDATISWDGSSLFIGKMTTIARLGVNGVGIAGVFTLQTDAKTVGDGIAYQYIASTDGDINRIYGYLGMKLTAVTSGAWSGDFVWHPTHLGVTIERMRLTSLGSLILNSSKNDVTSTLTFGRTTGGDATLSWDGVSQKFNNQIEVTGSNNFYNIVAKGPSPDSTTGALCGIAFSALNLSNRIKAAIGTVWEGLSWGRQDLVFAVRSTADGTNVTLADEKMRIAYDGTVTMANNLYVGGNVSAESFTDRTPFYEGDAVTEIMNIKGKDGEIDHSSLPSFARKEITKQRFEDVELTTEVDAKDAYTYDTRTVEVKGVEQEEIIEDSKRLKDTVYEDEKTGKFYEKYSVGEVKIKDGKPYQNIDVGEEIEQGRDLGAMISMLTVAVQQLTNRLNDIEKWAEKFGGASKQE